jgi:hypothetical protein
LYLIEKGSEVNKTNPYFRKFLQPLPNSYLSGETRTCPEAFEGGYNPLFILGYKSLETLLVCVALAWSFAFAQTCPDDTLLPVTAEGFAALVGDAGVARDEAVRDAQRRAVEQALGVFVESQTLVVNAQLVADEISTRASGFVQTYTITDEAKDDAGGTYTLTIEACVSQEKLRTDLENFGAILREQLGNPRVIIQAQEGESKIVTEAAYTLLNDHFSKLGFDVRRAASEDITTSDADVMITVNAQAVSTPTAINPKLFSSRVSLGLEASLVSTKQVVAQLSLSSEPKVSTSADTASVAALEETLSTQLDGFVSQLVSELNATVATNTSIQVVIKGLPSFQAFRTMQTFIEGVRGVEFVQERPFSTEQGILEVQGTLISSGDLASSLESYPDLKLKVTYLDSYKVEVEVSQ